MRFTKKETAKYEIRRGDVSLQALLRGFTTFSWDSKIHWNSRQQKAQVRVKTSGDESQITLVSIHV